MNRTLNQLQSDIIISAQRGYPIIIAGAFVFFVFTVLSFFIPLETLSLIWIFGLGAIFPTGLLIGKLKKINFLTRENPLGNLGGIVAATQGFFIPVFIIVYMNIPQYLPFTVGLLGGAHFLPYMWIYKSKAYLFITLGTCLVSFIFGGIFVSNAFFLVPLSICLVYTVGVILILNENKKN